MLNANQLVKLLDLKCNLNDYYLLKYTKLGLYSESSLLEQNPKLVFNGKPTKYGWKVLKEVDEITSGNKFSELWELYPKSDKVNGFPETRTNVRGSEASAKNEYTSLLLEGYKEEDILEGTKNYVDNLIAQSIFKNELTYLVGLARFLKEKKFLTKKFVQEETDCFF